MKGKQLPVDNMRVLHVASIARLALIPIALIVSRPIHCVADEPTEAEIIASTKGLVTRDSGVLKIKSRYGEMKIEDENKCGGFLKLLDIHHCVRHKLSAYFPDHSTILIYNSYQEGFDFTLININNFLEIGYTGLSTLFSWWKEVSDFRLFVSARETWNKNLQIRERFLGSGVGIRSHRRHIFRFRAMDGR